MSTRDVKDMLGITGESQGTPAPRPKKKSRNSVQRPDGITRELFALMGERAPPVPIQQPNQYKAKRQRTSTTRVKWRTVPFENEARTDGLLLRHWRKEHENPPTAVDDTEKSDVLEQEKQDVPAQAGNYRFAKYNIKFKGPRYDESQYNSLLQSDTWTKKETDYLVDLVYDFYGKWPLVYDRYEFQQDSVKAENEEAAAPVVPRGRTVEEMKSRYYEVAAKMMALETPVHVMTASEFADHEKMLKFNPKLETQRKKVKEGLQMRTAQEKQEEEYLLAELRRIYLHQERFAAEVKDIRDRLDHGLTADIPGAQTYQTSQEIGQLFQKVLALDKTKKRKSVVGETATTSPTPLNGQAGGVVTPGGTTANGTTNGGGKRASLAGGGAPAGPRTLTARQEARFGVSSHDRLTSGVSFRSDKLVKSRQAKSTVQTQKIAGALTELQVPELLQMPTAAVCTAMERLVAKVNLLLDARKVREKEENEVLIAKQQRELKEGGSAGAVPDSQSDPSSAETATAKPAEAPAVEDTKQDDDERVEEEEEEEEEEDDDDDVDDNDNDQDEVDEDNIAGDVSMANPADSGDEDEDEENNEEGERDAEAEAEVQEDEEQRLADLEATKEAAAAAGENGDDGEEEEEEEEEIVEEVEEQDDDEEMEDGDGEDEPVNNASAEKSEDASQDGQEIDTVNGSSAAVAFVPPPVRRGKRSASVLSASEGDGASKRFKATA